MKSLRSMSVPIGFTALMCVGLMTYSGAELVVHSVYDATDSLFARSSEKRVYSNGYLISHKDSNHFTEAVVFSEFQYDSGRVAKLSTWRNGVVDSSRLVLYGYDTAGRLTSLMRYLKTGGQDFAASQEYEYDGDLQMVVLFDSTGTFARKAWSVADSCGFIRYHVGFKADSVLDTTWVGERYYGDNCGVVATEHSYAPHDRNMQTALEYFANNRKYWKTYYSQADSTLERVIEEYSYPDSLTLQRLTLQIGYSQDTLGSFRLREVYSPAGPLVRRTQHWFGTHLVSDEHWLYSADSLVGYRKFGPDSLEIFAERVDIQRDSLGRVSEVVNYGYTGDTLWLHKYEYPGE